MAPTKSKVAIIGSGLAGLTLALALHQQNIPVTVYESRPAPLNIGGAVMLSPNALRVLDNLGIYDIFKTKGYNFTHLEYRDLEGNLTETYPFGGKEKYGYDGLRIYRYVLIEELVAALKEKSIPVHYGKKFTHVVKDTVEEGVVFAFADGTTESATLLVGADGIHSTVRRYLYPDLETKFIGMAGITAAVPTSQLKLPPGYYLPVTITSPKGAFVIAPQQPDGSEVLIGKQQRVIAPDQPGWDREFVSDKEGAIKFLQSDTSHFPEFIQNAVSYIDPKKVNKWPFFIVPKLEKWASETRQVIIVGDSAHAIPPSAGQGINQAFEDVYILALILSREKRIKSLQDALTFWQSYRQERVDKILELNQQIDLRRMPSNDKVVGVDSGVVKAEFDLTWLYNPNFPKVVNDWVSQQE
ncbi:putative salicylate hydroxylase [Talaromyces proteolyticus]|uniref:Salicylate hydroxylase n=1 Tax=Talaromyces proteolyticus TaxID=1131652 RepID=A0AAD4KI48_9EURO|nr:putative salicylate hydroxylase [Talaromyces proteolyticus]KAH8691624.1 putative salicylate hydroxylase [Talaromyces proteolyticus]